MSQEGRFPSFLFLGNFLVVADNLLHYNLLIKCEVKSLLTVLELLLSVLILVSFWSCFPKNLCTFWFVNRSCNLLGETSTTYLPFFCIFSSSSSSWCTSIRNLPVLAMLCFQRCRRIWWSHYLSCFGSGTVLKLVK